MKGKKCPKCERKIIGGQRSFIHDGVIFNTACNKCTFCEEERLTLLYDLPVSNKRGQTIQLGRTIFTERNLKLIVDWEKYANQKNQIIKSKIERLLIASLRLSYDESEKHKIIAGENEEVLNPIGSSEKAMLYFVRKNDAERYAGIVCGRNVKWRVEELPK